MGALDALCPAILVSRQDQQLRSRLCACVQATCQPKCPSAGTLHGPVPHSRSAAKPLLLERPTNVVQPIPRTGWHPAQLLCR